MLYYVFDGSYAGFLTCVFESFERKEHQVVPVCEERYEPGIFAECRRIATDFGKAERVRNGLRKKVSDRQAMDFYRVFLSEDSKAIQASFDIIQELFRGKEQLLQNYGDEKVLYFSKILGMVSRERHRMKAFVRFQKSSNGMFYAMVEPDYNVLPLISGFFQKRYADQVWLIYDVKRNYGLWYDKHAVSEVQLSQVEKTDLTLKSDVIELDDKEAHFQRLWQQYYKSTNITERRNMKLHLQHVPKRYWKYLTEKQ
jgi:probable DNA metabolism protein